MSKPLICPNCGAVVKKYRSPVPTVDIVIEVDDPSRKKGIILIKRRNPPYGWAIPGGFLDYGETVEQCAIREAKEETSLDISNLKLLGVYSDPGRDPREHTISTVFVASGEGTPEAADDAKELAIFTEDALPSPIAFDHSRILADYFKWKKGRRF